MSENLLKTRIQDDMKAAMRAKDAQRLGVIRLILAAIKQKEVDERIDLSDAQVIGILDKMIKQRRESIAQFQAAARQDLVDKEVFEIKVIEEYLPAALSENELDNLITAALASAGAISAGDMGKVMAILKPQIQGRCDMRQVSDKVKNKLT